MHTPEHAGTHVARQYITLLLGPQSQHEPRLQEEAEGCPWLLRKLCLDFPATSLGTAAALPGHAANLQSGSEIAQKGRSSLPGVGARRGAGAEFKGALSEVA